MLENVRRMREWREAGGRVLPRPDRAPCQEDVELGYRFPQRALEFGIAWLDAQAEWLAELERESQLDNG